MDFIFVFTIDAYPTRVTFIACQLGQGWLYFQHFFEEILFTCWRCSCVRCDLTDGSVNDSDDRKRTVQFRIRSQAR
jgi:hypothetical protein